MWMNPVTCSKAKSAELRAELKGQIDQDHPFRPWILVFTTIVFPLFEAVLVNMWTSAGLRGTAGPSLIVVGILHLVLGSIVIYQEFKLKSPLRVLADAADLADAHASVERELDRRVKTYRMFRDAIEEMNAQVCSVQNTGATYDAALRPIIKRFLDSICESIGVCSNRYTLEVYLCKHLLPEGVGYPSLGDYVLAFFDAPTVRQEDALKMGPGHPLILSSATNKERMLGQVAASPGLFTSNGNVVTAPYFEQYATHVIPTQCRTGHLGYVVFTTMQNNPIADDALETLGLIASVTSTFYARWSDCLQVRLLESQNQERFVVPAVNIHPTARNLY